MTRRKKHQLAPWTRAYPAQARKLRRREDPDLASERVLYAIEARAFVRALQKAGKTCPVVAAIPELRNGRKYGHPIKADIVEVHHSRGRRNGLLRDQRFWIGVSKQGHRWLHSNIEAARSRGWICEKGLWNSTDTEKADR